MAAAAEASPILQLDIVGGHYDAATKTVVSDGPDFTPLALLTQSGKRTTQELLADTYYISAAVSPNPVFGATGLGNFLWNATNHKVMNDMANGRPTLDSYLATFNITTSLAETNALHFDLYNNVLLNCRRNDSCHTELSLDMSAPISLDAESSNHRVAEPGSMLLMSVGLLIAARTLRRLKKTR